MLTIQHSFYDDKKAAIAHGIELPVACSKLWLYRSIAEYLGIDTTGIDDHTVLMDMIDQRNMELACIGVAEKLIENEATVLDQMAANIDRKPILKRDRQPLPKPVKRSEIKVVSKPIKRNQKPVYKTVWSNNVMGKALLSVGLIEVN